MPTWPTSLPSPALNTLQESPPNNIIRSNMSVGVDKVRRRTTASPRNISFDLKLTPAQVTTLDGFYVTDVVSGSLSFDYTHPRTNASVTARFVSPPSYAEQEGTIYNCSVELEILP